MGFPLDHRTHAEEELAGDESALKRKAPPTGLEGCAAKRKEEDGCPNREVEEATEVLVDSDLTAPADDPLNGEEEEEEDFAVFYEKLRARYAARVNDLFGPNSRGGRWSGLHNPYPPDDQDGEKEEELGAGDDGTPPPVST